MEITCTRCHQAVEAANCFCPACGLPQLLYSAESIPGQAPPERFTEPARDAGTVDWKRAMPTALMLAIPAGILCPMLYPMGFLGLLLMAMIAYWGVILYVRDQRPAWITVGAGARIGLVIGLVSSWLAAALIASTLFVMRFFLHQGKSIDDSWREAVNQWITEQMVQQWSSAGVDVKAWLLAPEGRAGLMLSSTLFLVACLTLFAVGGGALGARSHAHGRRPEV